MNTTYNNASIGLKKMFNANIGILCCMVFLIIPFVNIVAAIASIVFAIMSLIGLYYIGKDIPACFVAFVITIVRVVLSFILNLADKNSSFDALSSILSAVINIIVIFSVSSALKSVGAVSEANLGYITIAISIIAAVADYFFAGSADMSLILLGLVIDIIPLVFYLVFLHKSSNALY